MPPNNYRPQRQGQLTGFATVECLSFHSCNYFVDQLEVARGNFAQVDYRVTELLFYIRIYETYPKLSRMYSFWFSIYGNNPFSTEKPYELVHLVSKVNLARRSAFSQELYVSSQNERHRI